MSRQDEDRRPILARESAQDHEVENCSIPGKNGAIAKNGVSSSRRAAFKGSLPQLTVGSRYQTNGSQGTTSTTSCNSPKLNIGQESEEEPPKAGLMPDLQSVSLCDNCAGHDHQDKHHLVLQAGVPQVKSGPGMILFKGQQQQQQQQSLWQQFIYDQHPLNFRSLQFVERSRSAVLHTNGDCLSISSSSASSSSCSKTNHNGNIPTTNSNNNNSSASNQTNHSAVTNIINNNGGCSSQLQQVQPNTNMISVVNPVERIVELLAPMIIKSLCKYQ